MKDVVLILDELFSNIVIHGYLRDPGGKIQIEAEATTHQVQVTLMDQAPAFNPLTVPEPDTTLPLEKRPIGGLGLLFVRRTADDLQYELAPAGLPSITNWLRFTKHYVSSGRP